MSKTDGELRQRQAYTIRHTAIFAYKHGDITKLGLEALLDELIAADRSQLLERVLGELPKPTQAKPDDPPTIISYSNGRNSGIDDCVTAIRRLQGEGE